MSESNAPATSRPNRETARTGNRTDAAGMRIIMHLTRIPAARLRIIREGDEMLLSRQIYPDMHFQLSYGLRLTLSDKQPLGLTFDGSGSNLVPRDDALEAPTSRTLVDPPRPRSAACLPRPLLISFVCSVFQDRIQRVPVPKSSKTRRHGPEVHRLPTYGVGPNTYTLTASQTREGNPCRRPSRVAADPVSPVALPDSVIAMPRPQFGESSWRPTRSRSRRSRRKSRRLWSLSNRRP